MTNPFGTLRFRGFCAEALCQECGKPLETPGSSLPPSQRGVSVTLPEGKVVHRLCATSDWCIDFDFVGD